MELNYKIIYSNRNTIGITVERDCSVVVRAPFGSDLNGIQELIESKKLWIYQKQKHPQKYNKISHVKELVNGESVLYLGRNYRLEIKKSDRDEIRLAGKFIILHFAGGDFKNYFKEWYKKKAREKIPYRVRYHARNMGVKFNKVLITDMKYRWGSCTTKNNLNFNWRLIKAPTSVIDYVIIHELAHLLEPNHTSRFWNIIKAQTPNFMKAKEWLKDHGEILQNDF
jgi:hypothetical protein